jgi:hypothetical protein
MKLMVRSMKEEFCLMRISHYGVRTLYQKTWPSPNGLWNRYTSHYLRYHLS